MLPGPGPDIKHRLQTDVPSASLIETFLNTEERARAKYKVKIMTSVYSA